VRHSLAGVTFVDSIVSGREQKRRFVVTPHGGREVGEGLHEQYSPEMAIAHIRFSNCAIREQASFPGQTLITYQRIQVIWSCFKKKCNPNVCNINILNYLSIYYGL